MNDIRRSLLWAVFGISLVMLWDAWQVHNGQAPLFFNKPAAVQAQPESDQGSSGLPAAQKTGAGQLPVAGAVPAAQELTEVTTDVLKLTFDSAGGNVVDAQLLKYAQGLGGHKAEGFEPLSLLQQTRGRTYVVQSGLINGNFPNHTTAMTRLPGPTRLVHGLDELTITYASPAVGGVTLTKTYTIKRGSYVIDVRHDV